MSAYSTQRPRSRAGLVSSSAKSWEGLGTHAARNWARTSSMVPHALSSGRPACWMRCVRIATTRCVVSSVAATRCPP
ncbi:hypothetical protein SANTM175S_03318 [Streptomyces antimycoticus]